MAGPYLPAREAQPLDLLEATMGTGGLDDLDQLFRSVMPSRELEPEERVARFLYGMTKNPHGMAVMEWLMDITIRQPLRVTGKSIEETALNAAARQGINGVGEVILQAVARGRALEEKPQNGAGT